MNNSITKLDTIFTALKNKQGMDAAYYVDEMNYDYFKHDTLEARLETMTAIIQRINPASSTTINAFKGFFAQHAKLVPKLGYSEFVKFTDMFTGGIAFLPKSV